MTRGSLGVIADDFTGATDVAAALRRAGLETLLFFGGRPPEAPLPPHDAIVIALKTRSIPAAEAVATTLRSAEWLEAVGVEQFYVKYCSTFDSTPRGNIGPVLDALSARLGAHEVVTTPSSPEHGRTVFQGHLFVHDTLLSESPMRSHPLTPMTDSSVPRLLAAQSVNDVELVSRDALRRGELPRLLEERRVRGTRYLVTDAVDDDDLLAIATAASATPLLAGAAGLAGALASVRAEGADRAGTSPASGPARAHRSAVLAGSCSRRTLEQLAHYLAGNPGHRVAARHGATSDALAGEALTWFDEQDAAARPVIYSSLPPQELQRVQQALGARSAAELFETTLGEIAVGLRARGVDLLVVAGGETSGAVVEALGVTGVRIGSEAAPGVPWIHPIDEPDLTLLLKSGNFGAEDFFSTALDASRGGSEAGAR
jgi:uncharacterized protein YgbK (DUF1537 family)